MACEAAGLLTFIRSFKFIASLYMFSDVPSPLASLLNAFQEKDVNFTVVKPLIQGTKAAVDALCATPSEYFQSLLSVFAELEDYGVQIRGIHRWKIFVRMCTTDTYKHFKSILHIVFQM